MKSKPIVFFGNERLATGVRTNLPVLNALIKCGYTIAAIVTSYDEGQSRSKRTLEVAEFAKANNIEIIYSNRTENLIETLNNLGAKVAVLAAHGQIVSQEIIDIFPDGIINLHPSLLPKLRGSTPIESAILNGNNETGVSLMKLVKKMDAGPVYAQEIVKLRGDESKQELADMLGALGAEMLTKYLPKIVGSKLEPKAQDESQATISRLLKKEYGQLDTNLPAEILERKIRAFLGYPKTTLTINEQNIIVTKARIVKTQDDKNLTVKCNPGFLEIEELIAPSGKKMSGQDFVRGYIKPE